MHASVGLLLELGILLIALSVLGTLARRLSLSSVPLWYCNGSSQSWWSVTAAAVVAGACLVLPAPPPV